jgi:hypothetical protein
MNHRFIPELIEFRNKFNVHNMVTLKRSQIHDLLDCTNTGDLAGCLPHFAPGTMYVLHCVSPQELETLQNITEADDGIVANVFHETLNGHMTVYLCFKDLDQELLKKVSSALRSIVEESADHEVNESDIRRIACSFVETCMYF